MKKLYALFHPEQYHGWGKTRRYFEGWYYKVVNIEENKAFAFIPGIAMDEQGIQQAFVQVLDGINRTSEYHKFDPGEFLPESSNFKINIAHNFFSGEEIQLDLPTVKGRLQFKNQVPWRNRWYSPGIMGPYSFIPFMECYHGILSMDHIIQGQLNIRSETIDFTGGRGYIEKDWGHSFPRGYIWMQTNHFSRPKISLKVSVAKIPWLRSSIVGFIAGLWLYDRMFEFTTYNFSRLRKSFVDREKVEIVMENRNHRLEILVRRDASSELAAPILGLMNGRIEESMTARIEVRLFDRMGKKILLYDTGRNAGLEVAGKVDELMIK